ncbi:hypothetical protein M970_040930 [Encephalitozoon cuniculi EcunIII-L]|nr:hypothetical protein M970_040930 [Encephalitozoon cuniculi EcunIII-L]
MTAEEPSDEIIEESSISVSSQLRSEGLSFPTANSPDLGSDEAQKEGPQKPRLPSRLWVKRDVEYDLDPSHADRILDRFAFHVNTLREGGVYERDINEDAFYYKYKPVSVCDIETIRSSPLLQDRISCRRLRNISIQLVDYCMRINRDREALIDLGMDASTLPDDVQALIRSSILRKKRILSLIHKVRNCIGEIVLMGEKCCNYVEKSNTIAFKGISSFDDHTMEGSD